MTPEERAKAIMDGTHGRSIDRGELGGKIADAIRAAVLEEREACAKEDLHRFFDIDESMESIAAAIRARGA